MLHPFVLDKRVDSVAACAICAQELETLEAGRQHHYLIPMAAARRGKLKKAGTKLHVFMDHIFTAQHIKL